MKLPTLEEQVCTLETAEKLSKIGFDIETHYEWVQLESDCIDASQNKWMPPTLMTRETRLELGAHTIFQFPAPTVAELGVLLPSSQISAAKLFDIEYSKRDRIFTIKITSFTFDKESKYFTNQIEAQARADALIWLKDNGYLDQPTS